MLRSPDELLPPDVPGDLRRLLAYWIELADGRAMPAFEEFDPVEVPWALSRLFVVRVVDGGSDFVYRLAGEAISGRGPPSRRHAHAGAALGALGFRLT